MSDEAKAVERCGTGAGVAIPDGGKGREGGEKGATSHSKETTREPNFPGRVLSVEPGASALSFSPWGEARERSGKPEAPGQSASGKGGAQ